MYKVVESPALKVVIQASSVKELKQKLTELAGAIVVNETASQSKESMRVETSTTPVTINPAPFPDQSCPALEESEEAEETATQYTPGDVDVRGLPWDARIHAATKAKTKKGQWKYKRGADDALINQVESELAMQARQQQVVAPFPQAVAVPSPFPQPVVMQPQPVAAPVVTQEIPQFIQPPVAAPTQAPAQQYQDPVAATAQAAPSVKPAHSLTTFAANIVPVLTQLVASGAINQNYIDACKKHFNITQIWEVANNPVHLQEMFNMFVQSGLITKID